MTDTSNWVSGKLSAPDTHGGSGAVSDASELEIVIMDHPLIEECKVVEVRDMLDKPHLKLFIKPQAPDQYLEELISWSVLRLPQSAVPRFVAFVDDFEHLPDNSISDASLSRSVEDCLDLEADRRWRTLLSSLPLY
jgi:crotonobetaine/carnitine-CoA ligase